MSGTRELVLYLYLVVVAIGLLGILAGMRTLHQRRKRAEQTAIWSQKAARDFAMLLGDAQRLLARAELLYMRLDAGVLAALLDQELHPSERALITKAVTRPLGEADRIRHWSDRVDNAEAKYSDWLGQTPPVQGQDPIEVR